MTFTFKTCLLNTSTTLIISLTVWKMCLLHRLLYKIDKCSHHECKSSLGLNLPFQEALHRLLLYKHWSQRRKCIAGWTEKSAAFVYWLFEAKRSAICLASEYSPSLRSCILIASTTSHTTEQQSILLLYGRAY